MTKTLSYVLGFVLGALIVAPPLNYAIPVVINSFSWCYLVVIAGLFGMLLLSTSLNASLKILAVYLFAVTFWSQAPYMSFCAYVLVVVTLYFFVGCLRADFGPILNIIEAAFWFELILGIMQLLGKDTLMNFDRPQPVFLGSVMQYMRFASVLACMAPFLILKNKWYLPLIAVLCIVTKSSSFALSLIAGCMVYALLVSDKKWLIALLAVLGVASYAAYDFGSFHGAIVASNGGRLISWFVVLKTWVFDTSLSKAVDPYGLTGPFKWQWFLFGHGMDTFLPLFPIFKHDMNPFPQAHNCWLQFLWEIGLVGTSLIVGYSARLVSRLYAAREYLLLAGLACIGTNMFFAFPTRMTQTMLLIVAYLAYCERRARDKAQTTQHGFSWRDRFLYDFLVTFNRVLPRF